MVAGITYNRASSLPSAAGWIEGLMSGPLALTVATLAIGLFGLTMLSGRISVKAAARVVLGCFILLGSAALARGLMGLLHDDHGPVIVESPAVLAVSPSPQGIQIPLTSGVTPNTNPFDPYASQPSGPKTESPVP